MTTALKISEAASLALHTVGVMVQAPERLVSNQEIAAQLEVSEHHLAKVHQRLARAGLIHAVRGPGGGFRLARPADEITLLQVVQAVEGPFEPNRCLLGRKECLKSSCILGELSGSINLQVREFLATHTVASLAV